MALPWPAWQMVQPNFSIGCGLLESTNRSSRGCDANCVTWPAVRLTVRAWLGRSPGSKPRFSPLSLRSCRLPGRLQLLRKRLRLAEVLVLLLDADQVRLDRGVADGRHDFRSVRFRIAQLAEDAADHQERIGVVALAMVTRLFGRMFSSLSETPSMVTTASIGSPAGLAETA